MRSNVFSSPLLPPPPVHFRFTSFTLLLSRCPPSCVVGVGHGLPTLEQVVGALQVGAGVRSLATAVQDGAPVAVGDRLAQTPVEGRGLTKKEEVSCITGQDNTGSSINMSMID